MRSFIVTFLLLTTASLCTGFGAPGYSCDPAKCLAAANCQCPSVTGPGNIATADLPQFILITHDDAVSAIADRGVRSITDGHKNPNGCNVPATWFTTEDGTDCNLVKTLYEQNHEIALHTVHHAQLTPALKNIEEEMMGVRTFLNTQCGIPLADLVGFRSPYLITNPTVRSILAKNKILYDSSIDEFVGNSSYTTQTFGTRLYPYTFDNGIPQFCNWTYPDGQCTSTERYPGMWEVPMWDLPYDASNTQQKAYTMDPEGGFGGDLFTTFQTNFDQAYNGNRAPFPIYVHAPWFTPDHIALTNKFIEYALSKPNVYFVTIRQMLEWMKNPVPASQLATTLTCNPTDLKPPVPEQPCQNYTIASGDYLDLIAGKLGVNSADVLALNPGLTSNIQPGQTVRIPPWDSTCPGAAAAVAAGAVLTKPSPVASAETVSTPAETVSTAPAAAPAASTTSTATTVPVVAPAPTATPITTAATATGPVDKVEMDFVLKGMAENDFTAQGRNNVINVLSQLLEVFPDHITVAETPVIARRRSRNLLQMTTMAATTTSTTPTPVAAAVPAAAPAPNALQIHAVIAADDPATTYVKLDQEIKQGEFESLLNALGLTAVGVPTYVAYKGGVKIEDPAAVAAASAPVATPSTAPSSSSSSSSGLSTPVIIGIAVGGGVLLLAAILTTVLCVRRKRAAARKTDLGSSKEKNNSQFMVHQLSASGRHVGATASLKVKTGGNTSGASSIKDDDSVGVKGDSPTSATYRSNAANNAFMV